MRARKGGRIDVTCGNCLTQAAYRTTSVLVVQADGGLLVMFVCVVCGPGWERVTDLDDRLDVLGTGVALRVPAEPTGWPARASLGSPLFPAAGRVRQAPLLRLARRVGRSFRSEGK